VKPKDQIREAIANTPTQERDELSQFKRFLRQAIPPVPPHQLDPPADLWPQLRARLESQLPSDRAAITAGASLRAPIRVPWFDWALAALAAVTLFFFPRVIPALLYHF
jgi:hypothetical protein